MVNTKAELNRYFDLIDRRVPIRVSRSIRWLRKPTSFGARLVVASLLIIGGIFSFLPVLGLWMLPLGLLLIARDVPFFAKAPREKSGVGRGRIAGAKDEMAKQSRRHGAF